MLLPNDTTLIPAISLLFIGIGLWILAHPLAVVCRAFPRIAIICAALSVRAVPSFLLDRGLPFDIDAHWWVGVLALNHLNVYESPLAQGRYPYPPVHAYISALIVALSHDDRAVFLVVDKLVPALCGTLLSLVVWGCARRLGYAPVRCLFCGLLYALNPLAILVTGFHGQFEEIPLLGVGLALYLLLNQSPNRRTIGLAGLALGVAVAYKSWPLLFALPLLLLIPSWWRRVVFTVAVAVPLLLSLALYGLAFGHRGLIDAFERVRGYSGSTGFCWGYVSVIRSCWIHPESMRPNAWITSLNSTLLLVGLLSTAIFILWRGRPLPGAVLLALLFYLFSPGWGPNYSVWILPAVILLSPSAAVIYTASLLPVVGLTYFDSLYAAYGHSAVSWTVLKPLEAGFGLISWLVICAMFVALCVKIDWQEAVSTSRNHLFSLDHFPLLSPVTSIVESKS